MHPVLSPARRPFGITATTIQAARGRVMKVRLSYCGRHSALHVDIRRNATEATHAAADFLARWIGDTPGGRLMVAAGNTPLPLYASLAERKLDYAGLRVYVLDEYVDVPTADPRTCTNLLRARVADAWRVRPTQFFGLSSEPATALASVTAHEQAIAAGGGLDMIVLGLGQNGHLGFNEPGSAEDSVARIVDLDQISVDANRTWFGGDFAPDKGATVGLSTILAARRVIILAFGAAKAHAVQAMLEEPPSEACPASFLQRHPEVHTFFDDAAAARLTGPNRAPAEC